MAKKENRFVTVYEQKYFTSGTEILVDKKNRSQLFVSSKW